MFREKAMAQMLGPDPIDQVMTVTKPAGWIQLGALATLVSVGLVWSALADVPLKIKSKGVLLNEAGLVEITTASRGRMTEIDVGVGDFVRKGDLIAIEAQPEFDSQLAIRRAQLAEAKANERALLGLDQQLANAQGSAGVARLRSARERIGLLEGQERALADRTRGLQGLADRGHVSKETLLRSESELSGIRQQLASFRNEVVSAQSDDRIQVVQRRRELAAVQSNIARLQAEIGPLEQQATNDREIRSPYTGRITELRYGAGEYVDVGTPIASLAQSVGTDEGKLNAIAFVPAEQGKEIRKGMRVDVAPAGVKTNEYGFIVGEVEDVGRSPATTAGMMRVLKNDQLVRQLSEQGAPIKVVVALRLADTPSGFQWTSSMGPKTKVDSGTPMTAEFVTRKQRLLGLIIPPLARFFAD